MKSNSRKNIIEKRIKKVKALERELDKIRIAEKNLGYVKLDKPLRDGWYRTFKLRDDIKKHKQLKVYQEILEATTTKIWGREKKYIDKKWKTYFTKSCFVYQYPGVKYLAQKEYSKLSSKARKYFVPIKIKFYYHYQKIYFCTLPRYYFVTNYERAYITSRNIISPILQSRRQEIMEILCNAELRKYSSYYNYNHRYYFNPVRKRRRKEKKELRRVDIW